MGLTGIRRIEEYFPVKDENAEYDPMLQTMESKICDLSSLRMTPNPEDSAFFIK
jgi:phosphoribosylformylglycinamidine synthase